ncbi:phosphatidylinositol phosphate synthase [Nocardioides donggukensis]|uniref:Phosphatidylinositol phosphate synthase n=1 Tax=Nocardioides donggukensis TaxID=2774019 RepID=A0A927K8W2_9ACTN|nr:CDP-alcohol phosphatidyltransferase family protein [Nocardioides donggukensis]MBD8869785.1 CDP-alcohol phosphatidyltransferase family protein [Nocardioides donggukensis]
MMERFRAFWTKVISPVAHLLIRLGVSADAVTVVGTLGVSAGALIFFPQGMLLTGVLVITAFVFSDLVDGHMARLTGKTNKFGAFLDSTLDRIGDGAIFAGLALYFAGPGDSDLYLVLTLVCLVMGGVTSYARSKAEGLGFTAKVGIAERADRLVAILVMTGLGALLGLPVLMHLTLWALALASTVTVVQRVWVVRQQAYAGT